MFSFTKYIRNQEVRPNYHNGDILNTQSKNVIHSLVIYWESNI